MTINKRKANFKRLVLCKRISDLVNLIPIIKWSLLLPPKSTWKSDGFEDSDFDFWSSWTTLLSSLSSFDPAPKSLENRSKCSTLTWNTPPQTKKRKENKMKKRKRKDKTIMKETKKKRKLRRKKWYEQDFPFSLSDLYGQVKKDSYFSNY